MALSKQMEMFEEGGLKEEGGMVDEVSGNDVPPGSTREEVRDDIPAQLSEGEFVFPADVVRYIGLEKLMMLRQQAKQGLKEMEAMGQMGNSDEATMPDDLPFDETDLDIEDDLEYNEGGVVYTPGDFEGLMGGKPTGPQTQNVRYYNEKLRQVRIIPHFINADGSLGGTIYPVPEGFVPSDKEVPQEEEKEETSEKPVVRQESGDNNDSDDVTGALGGARTSIGGEEYAISYGLDGSVSLQSVDNYKATGRVNFQPATPEVTQAIKDQRTGQLAQLGKVTGLKATAAAEIAKKMGIETPRYDKLGKAINKARAATSKLDKINPRDIFDIDKAMKGATVRDPAVARVDDLSRAQVTSLQDAITTGKGTETFTEQEVADIAAKAEKDRIAEVQRQEKKQRDVLTLAEERRAQKRMAANKAAQEKAEAEGRVTGREAGMSMGGSDDPGDSGYSTSDNFDSDTGFGSDISTAVGGLIPKKKKKTKKMKRGGLASKK
jgi:hypothetical protein